MGAIASAALLLLCDCDAVGDTLNKVDLQVLDLPVFWDSQIDQELTKQSVFNSEDWEILMGKVRTQKVVMLEKGCGRPKNMLATLEDGTKVCCRYREHQLKELRGDIYSFYFNTMLNLWKVPPSVFVLVDFSQPQWKQVEKAALQSGWSDHSQVVMSHYIKDLNDVFIPKIFQDRKNNLTLKGMLQTTADRKLQLAQWSDLIVFDYIIGHTDRLFNTLYNLQWNRAMMQMPVHNLKQTGSGQLVLLDNESGFWMGYSLNEWDPVKYELQVHFLNQLCVFRKSTIQQIISLTSNNDPEVTVDMEVEKYVESHDSYSFKYLPKLSAVHRQELILRVKTVIDHIRGCFMHGDN